MCRIHSNAALSLLTGVKRMIKPTLYILLALSLAACAGGDCEPQAVVSPAADVVTASPATPAHPAKPPTLTPAPAPAPAPLPTPTPEPITACPQNSTACAPSPVQVPVRPIVTTPSPAPTCVRNADPLVYIDPFWVDNCGNKYSTPTTN
jgi:hypothetical protein